MVSKLQIYDPRERAVVGAADLGLRVIAPVSRLFRRRASRDPQRILLLRLERIGDLLMTLDAIADVVSAAPSAAIDLVVGSWNEGLARAIPGLHRVETLDASWLARGEGGASLPALLRRARSWRTSHYDLAINFEPDIRSQLLLASSGAARIAGFSSGGGGPLLDVAIPFDSKAHTSDNARRLVAAALDVPLPTKSATRINIPDQARARARELLGAHRAPLVGVHASGGREIKQWPVERFADVAVRLGRERGATIVLTGSGADRSMVDAVRRRLELLPTIDASGTIDLLTLAAVLERLDVFVTGDTGPMHLAAAVGTPIVAVFGPSDPSRYAPRGDRDRIVRIDLPCSPCNRIRRPPVRCTGHTPDCLSGIDVERVFNAAVQALNAPAVAS
jgi:ADP-heptose:LPS heptosyltransferase